MGVANGALVLGQWDLVFTVSGVSNACYTRPGVSGTPRHSLKQRRQPADAEENIPSYFLQLPLGSFLASWQLVLGIACCRMITALCPLEGAVLPQRSPAVLTVDQRRRTNCCCIKITGTLPSCIIQSPRLFSQGLPALGNLDGKDNTLTHPGHGRPLCLAVGAKSIGVWGHCAAFASTSRVVLEWYLA